MEKTQSVTLLHKVFVCILTTVLTTYTINETTRQLKTIWQYPEGIKDTLFAKVYSLDKDNRMTLLGVMGKDTVNLDLSKKEVRSITKTY